MNSSKVVHIAGILVFFYFQNGIQATCPNLPITTKPFDGFDERFNLHLYKSVDDRVQSPFFGFEDDNREIHLVNGKMVVSYCHNAFTFDAIRYNVVLFVDFNNQTSKLKIEYYDNSSYVARSCHAKFKMTEIYLLDFHPTNFVSFYSCLMAVIDGKPIKFEGVYIFINVEIISSAGKRNIDYLESLNNTYNFLQLQTNITKESLKIKGKFIRGNDTSCNAIINSNCEKAVIGSNADEEGIFVEIYYCIGVIFFILIVKHIVSLFIKKCKISRQVEPLTGVRS